MKMMLTTSLAIGVSLLFTGCKSSENGADPTENILSTFSIAASNDCANHVKPVPGYHYHSDGSCSSVEF